MPRPLFCGARRRFLSILSSCVFFSLPCFVTVVYDFQSVTVATEEQNTKASGLYEVSQRVEGRDNKPLIAVGTTHGIVA